MKPKKKRIVWMVEDTAGVYIMHKGLVLGASFPTRKIAKRYGKPIKFVEPI